MTWHAYVHVCASLQASTASDMNAHILDNYLCTWHIFCEYLHIPRSKFLLNPAQKLTAFFVILTIILLSMFILFFNLCFLSFAVLYLCLFFLIFFVYCYAWNTRANYLYIIKQINKPDPENVISSLAAPFFVFFERHYLWIELWL